MFIQRVDTSNQVSNSISSVPDTRNNLLNQIRQGVELKSVLLHLTIVLKETTYLLDFNLQVQPIQKKSSNNLETDGLAGALARALAERARVIHSDSSTSDSSEGDDDDWDD